MNGKNCVASDWFNLKNNLIQKYIKLKYPLLILLYTVRRLLWGIFCNRIQFINVCRPCDACTSEMRTRQCGSGYSRCSPTVRIGRERRATRRIVSQWHSLYAASLTCRILRRKRSCAYVVFYRSDRHTPYVATVHKHQNCTVRSDKHDN